MAGEGEPEKTVPASKVLLKAGLLIYLAALLLQDALLSGTDWNAKPR